MSKIKPKINDLIHNKIAAAAPPPPPQIPTKKKKKVYKTENPRLCFGLGCFTKLWWGLPPGKTDDGVEDPREGEADTRIGPEGVKGGLAYKVFYGLHEQIQAPDRRHVQRQRYRREGHREE